MLLTRCPACETMFRVTAEQLKVRAGKVRCGQCNSVFNALETLGAMPNGQRPGPAPGGDHDAVAAPPADSFPAVTAPAAGAAAPEESPPVVDFPAIAGSAPAGTAEQAPAPPEALDTYLLEEGGAGPSPRRHAFAWTFAALLMLILLGVQGAHIFRAELAVAEPGLRPALEQLCAALGCDIPLPRKPELVSIEASDLHPDPKGGSVLALAATLKNRAPFVQDYPHLELTLTDTLDKPLLRRVLMPQEYLSEGVDARAGFAANGELAVSLWLDVAGVGATGYRLYLFYP